MFLEEGHHSEEFVGGAEFDGHQETAAADFLHVRGVFECLLIPSAFPLDLLYKVVVQNIVQGGETGGAAHGMAADGRRRW